VLWTLLNSVSSAVAAKTANCVLHSQAIATTKHEVFVLELKVHSLSFRKAKLAGCILIVRTPSGVDPVSDEMGLSLGVDLVGGVPSGTRIGSLSDSSNRRVPLVREDGVWKGSAGGGFTADILMISS
jgi:hypothetical protein